MSGKKRFKSAMRSVRALNALRVREGEWVWSSGKRRINGEERSVWVLYRYA